jgi:hypothetical protein
MDLAHISSFLWAASFFVNVVLLVVLFYRRHVRSFPAFTALVVLNIARTIALFLIRQLGTPPQYFFTFWALAVVDTGLQIAIGYEVAAMVFRPMGEWAADIKGRLLLWVGISIAVAAVLTLLQQPVQQAWFATVILKASLFSAALMTELFVGMLALSSIAGLNWKSHVASISEGLAVYSFSNILIESANTVFGFGDKGDIYNTLQSVRRGLYIVCVIYWAVRLWRNAPAPRAMTKVMKGQVSAIRTALTARIDALDTECRR